MGVPEGLAGSFGSWAGTNRLWRSWLPEEERLAESLASATVAPAARHTFARIEYTWSLEGEAHEGVILIGQNPDTGALQAVWTDSWHMGHTLMVCQGTESAGSVVIQGSYAAPPGPDWGWRITIEVAGADSLGMTMHNIAPGGEEDLAVEARFVRQ
jgi:hypothetical protein